MKGTTVIKNLAANGGSQTMINERDKYVNFTLSAENSTMDLTVEFFDFEGQSVSSFTVNSKFNIIAKGSRISKITLSDSNSYNAVLSYKVFESAEPVTENIEFRFV